MKPTVKLRPHTPPVACWIALLAPIISAAWGCPGSENANRPPDQDLSVAGDGFDVIENDAGSELDADVWEDGGLDLAGDANVDGGSDGVVDDIDAVEDEEVDNGGPGLENRMEFVAAGSAGAYTGVDLHVGGDVVGRIRFSSEDAILAAQLNAAGRDRLVFDGLYGAAGCGVTVDGQVWFDGSSEDGFPVVGVELSVIEFDANEWQGCAGIGPFHFLKLYLDSALLFSQRGFLIPTPLEDPFPLLVAPFNGRPQLPASWSRHWSMAPPITAYPLPFTGLWDPDSAIFLGYSFATERMTTHGERLVASAYRYEPATTAPIEGEGVDRQSIALVHPYQGIGYQTLTFFEAPVTIDLRFELIWSTTMHRSGDPNELFFDDFIAHHGDQLPPVPQVVDMGFIAGEARTTSANYGLGRQRLNYRIEARTPFWSRFLEEGSQLLYPETRYYDSYVLAVLRGEDTALLNALLEDIEELVPYVERFELGGLPCASIPRPHEGDWVAAFGGPGARTLHGTEVFAFAQMLAELVHLWPLYPPEDFEGTPPPLDEYEELVHLFRNFAEVFVWSRAEIVDLPCCQFAMGGSYVIGFLAAYYRAFRNHPIHAQRAQESLELMRRIAYRYLPIWVADSDPDDGIYPSFLITPVTGRDWAGTACSNEVAKVLEGIALAYLFTGDRWLKYWLLGALDRWPTLYRPTYMETPEFDPLSAFPMMSTTENYGIGEGAAFVEKGESTNYGHHYTMPLFWPIRDRNAGIETQVRILAGPGGVFVTNKNGVHTTVTRYRYGGDDALGFRIVTEMESVAAYLSVPHVDLTDKVVRRNGQVLVEGSDYHVHLARPSLILLRSLSDGDELTIGDLPVDAAELDILPPRQMEGAVPDEVGGFTVHPLLFDTTMESDWRTVTGYPGLPRGPMMSYGVPVFVAPRGNADRHDAVAEPFTLDLTGTESTAVFVLFGAEEPTRASVRLSGCTAVDTVLIPEEAALFWRLVPHMYSYRVYLAFAPLSEGCTRPEIVPQGALVLSVTSFHGDGEVLERIIANLEGGIAKSYQEFLDLRTIEELDELIEALVVPDGSIALLPPSYFSDTNLETRQNPTLMRLVFMSSLVDKVDFIADPQVLIQPERFNPQHYPLALYNGLERYYHTIAAAGSIEPIEGNARQAHLDYLAHGGILLLVDSYYHPMYYPVHRIDGFDSVVLEYPEGHLFSNGFGLPIQAVFRNEDKTAAFRNLLPFALPSVPLSFPIPSNDPRVDTVAQEQPGFLYRHWLDAVEYATYPGGIGMETPLGSVALTASSAQGGQLGYVWFRLSERNSHGLAVVAGMLEEALRDAFGPGQ